MEENEADEQVQRRIDMARRVLDAFTSAFHRPDPVNRSASCSGPVGGRGGQTGREPVPVPAMTVDRFPYDTDVLAIVQDLERRVFPQRQAVARQRQIEARARIVPMTGTRRGQNRGRAGRLVKFDTIAEGDEGAPTGLGSQRRSSLQPGILGAASNWRRESRVLASRPATAAGVRGKSRDRTNRRSRTAFGVRPVKGGAEPPAGLPGVGKKLGKINAKKKRQKDAPAKVTAVMDTLVEEGETDHDSVTGGETDESADSEKSQNTAGEPIDNAELEREEREAYCAAVDVLDNGRRPMYCASPLGQYFSADGGGEWPCSRSEPAVEQRCVPQATRLLPGLREEDDSSVDDEDMTLYKRHDGTTFGLLPGQYDAATVRRLIQHQVTCDICRRDAKEKELAEAARGGPVREFQFFQNPRDLDDVLQNAAFFASNYDRSALVQKLGDLLTTSEGFAFWALLQRKRKERAAKRGEQCERVSKTYQCRESRASGVLQSAQGGIAARAGSERLQGEQQPHSNGDLNTSRAPPVPHCEHDNST
eukprot:scpid65135/ scgid29998/ 